MSTVSSVEWSSEWITSTAGWYNEPGWAYPGGDIFKSREDDVEACRTTCKENGANFFTYRTKTSNGKEIAKKGKNRFCKATKGGINGGGPVQDENVHSGTTEPCMKSNR